MPTRLCGLLPTAALLGLLVGCGYTAGGPFRQDVKTVHVEMIESRTFRRDIEFQLTEALKKRIATDTPYRIAPKRVADSVLRGQVLEVRQAAWAPDELSRLPREKQLTLIMALKWQSLRTGELFVDQPIELQAVDYMEPLEESEAFAIEQAADKMAAKIVRRMYDDGW